MSLFRHKAAQNLRFPSSATEFWQPAKSLTAHKSHRTNPSLNALKQGIHIIFGAAAIKLYLKANFFYPQVKSLLKDKNLKSMVCLKGDWQH